MQNQKNIDEVIDQFLVELKTTVSETILDEQNLWNAGRIGTYLGGITANTILRNYVTLDSFPKSFSPPECPHLRLWHAHEIKAWATSSAPKN